MDFYYYFFKENVIEITVLSKVCNRPYRQEVKKTGKEKSCSSGNELVESTFAPGQELNP